MKKTYTFELQFKVRDYECDLQGVVNNANYLHYLEHTRHEFLKFAGADFAELHNQGLDGVVHRIEIDYKHSLRSGDEFKVCSNTYKDGLLKLVFEQDVYKIPNNELVVKAKVYTVLVRNGRPIPFPEEIVKRLGGESQQE